MKETFSGERKSAAAAAAWFDLLTGAHFFTFAASDDLSFRAGAIDRPTAFGGAEDGSGNLPLLSVGGRSGASLISPQEILYKEEGGEV